MVAPLNEKTIIKSNNIHTHTHTHIRTYMLYYSVKFENYAKRVQRVQPILAILTLTKYTAVAPFGCTLGKFD